MSLYQLHRAVWDSIRAAETNATAGPDFDVSRYDLSEDERKALETADVGALYQLGLHAVLLNRFCRQAGYSRNDYRAILEKFATPEERTARWQK